MDQLFCFVSFPQKISLVLYMCSCECLFSLVFKLSIEKGDITVSGRVFQSFIALVLKKFLLLSSRFDFGISCILIPLVSRLLISNNFPVASWSYRPVKILKISMIRPLFLLYRIVGIFGVLERSS